MVDSVSVKTALSQIEHVQRVQQVRQKEGDVQQKQFHAHMVQQTGERLKQVGNTPKTEKAEVRERHGRTRENAAGRDDRPDRRQDGENGSENGRTDQRGSVIDVKV